MAEGSIAEWLDRDGGDEPPPGDEDRFWRPDADRAEQEERSRRLWRLAAAFWGLLVVAGAVLLVAGRLTGAPPEGLAGSSPEDGGAGAAVGLPDAAGEAAGGLPDAGTTAPGDVPTTTPAALDSAEGDRFGALAAVAVRLAMTADDDPARYVDLVEPEVVERHGDVAVVTVAAVVLEGREGRWESVRPARYGVAVRDTAEGPALLGTPWPLAPPEVPSSAPADADDLDDPAMAAEVAAALDAAGWGEPTAVALLPEVGEAWLQVRVTALAPGETGARTHDVLLHRGEHLRLAGTSR